MQQTHQEDSHCGGDMQDARKAEAAVRRQRREKQGDTGHCGKQNAGARKPIVHQEPGPAFASAQETKHCSAEGICCSSGVQKAQNRGGRMLGSQTAYSAPTGT